MGTRDPRIDAYIKKAPEFARPILAYVREIVHAGCPEVVETMKWSHPGFEYQGFLAGMAAFKAHATFGFWKGKLVLGESADQTTSMGSFGRLTSVKDLPAKKLLLGYVKAAAKLNALGVKAPPRPKKHPKPEIPVPKELAAALTRDKKAKAHWDAFPPSHRREYLEWITGAKQEATRERRLATAIAQIAEGKSQNWKCQNC